MREKHQLLERDESCQRCNPGMCSHSDCCSPLKLFSFQTFGNPLSFQRVANGRSLSYSTQKLGFTNTHSPWHFQRQETTKRGWFSSPHETQQKTLLDNRKTQRIGVLGDPTETRVAEL